MTRIHRGQLFMRGGWRDGDATLTAVAGIAEVDAGAGEHVVHGYGAQLIGGDILLSATGYTAANEEEHLGSGEVDYMITDTQWPRPSGGVLAGGGLMLRRTRAPAAPGRELAIVAGLFSCDGTVFADQQFADISGDMTARLAISGRRCVKEWRTNGSTISQVMKSPRWGWGDEPWGFNSTMDLKSIDEAMRVEALADDPNHDPEELAEARRTPGGWAPQVGRVGSAYDADYDRFRTRMIAEHGRLPWDGVLTRSESEARAESAGRIIRELKLAA